MVISPFAKKNFVFAHAYGLHRLSALHRDAVEAADAHRDAAMPDMTEFFDFANKPWATPPSPRRRTRAEPATSPNNSCLQPHSFALFRAAPRQKSSATSRAGAGNLIPRQGLGILC